MADSDGKVRIVIDTNAESAAKALNDVGTAFKKNADTIQKSATVYNGYEKAISDNIQVLKELALGGNQNTEGFKKLSEETKNYKRALENANNEVNKAVGGFQQQNSPVSALTSKLKGLVGAYLSIKGAVAVFNGVMQSTEAFREQERAIASLDTTLANAGVYSAQYSRQIQELASSIQNYSNYGDEAIIKAQALGQSFIGQTKITDELTRAVVDFAAATGMDLEQAFTLVGKSIGSNTNALGRYGIELKNGMSDSQKMAVISKQLGDRYEGQAKQMANASNQLKNAIGDLAEQLGGVFNPIVEKTQKVLIKATTALTEWVKKTREATNQNNINALNEALKYQQEQLKNATGEEKKLWEQRIAQTQKYINSQKQTTITNKKPVKVQDEILSTGTSDTTSKTRSYGSASQAKQIKDSYDLATEAVEKARRAVLNAGVQFGASSPQVAAAFENYKKANQSISDVEKIFKIEETKGAYQQLTETVSQLTAKLRDLAATNQVGSAEWVNTKTALAGVQSQLQEVNTALNDEGIKIEDKAKQISDSLSSNLIGAIRNGGNAFEMFSNIAVNALQRILSKILEMSVIEPMLNSIKNLTGNGGIFGTLFGGIFGFKNGAAFNNGKVVPFARGGIVNKPTLFPMANGGTGLMGEAGAEAVMPLTRKNGKLGVEATGTSQTVVNIYNQSGAEIETRQKDDGGMDIFIKRVNSALMNQRTSRGFKEAYQRESSKGVQAC
ncbi:MAG: phage tail tape measure protein [Clostridia bacterium]|nr:phage tail tape measure protein [Clostridia bacterium]